jgi:hypothetical protein
MGKPKVKRITVAGCCDCRIWIIAKGPCSTASARQLRAAFTNTPSTSSSAGIVLNLARL